MSDPLWSLLIGVLLILMVLGTTLLAQLLLSSATIYLLVGYALGPGGLDVITPDPALHSIFLARVSEVALLISLFTVGLKMGNVSPRDRRWLLPLRLAFLSMAITVGLIAAVGVWGLGLSPGAAVLLGGVLAPTDPVLASGVQTRGGIDPDRLRFSLAGEGGLNDGTAFPFVLLGLGLLGHYDLGASGLRWLLVDVLWATGGGVLIGATLGALIGRLVVHLRTRHQHAVGLDEFLSLGLVAVAYGLAQLCLASGFLAVFATGVALQRVRERPRAGTTSLDEPTAAPPSLGPDERATHSHHASAAMTHAVLGFNEQLERLGEIAIVLLVGAMLPFATPSAELAWFIPLLFVLLRSLSVLVGTWGEPMRWRQRTLICWFGIRGIGSIFYLLFALRHGVSGPLAETLTTFTLMTVAASIVLHGVSAGPLMKWYARRGPVPTWLFRAPGQGSKR